ncbi:exocyst complex component 7-like isoform X2 [Ptychodera flava]|uniref:exocyst complex component 7-like isoform X2 n=1 Tax=Ptychodera flava TaxID=63121 RepID=UPI00396A684A
MDGRVISRREIDEKLRQESTNLSLLKESLNKSDQLTNNMVSILSSFENRLHKLEATIVPVHKETISLQQLQENIEKTLGAFDHVISYYEVAKEVEGTIREGPSGNIEKYLACMGKIENAVEFFTENNPGSPELHTAKSLFESGKEGLEREFRTLLTRHSKPVPPVMILDMIGTDEERTMEELAEIAKWLLGRGSLDFMNVYHQIRSNVLLRSLEGLKDHLHKKSSGSTGAPYSPAPGSGKLKLGVKDTPKRTALKRAQFQKKTGTLQKLDAGYRRPSPMTPDTKYEEVIEVEYDAFITCVSALLKLMQSEAQLMTGIIPDQHQRKIFDVLIQPGFDSVIQDGEGIVQSVKKSIMKHDYTAVLPLLPILKHLQSIKPEFDDTLQATAPKTRGKLPQLCTSMEIVGAKGLEEFFEIIKSDPDKQSNMPKDGTVHELTSNAIIFLENLLEYVETAGAMLASGMGGTKESAKVTNEAKRKRVSIYNAKVLGALGLNLNQKTKIYADQSLGAIFLLNNFHYILKSLQRSGMIKLIEQANPSVGQHYEEVILEQKKNYSKSWSRVLTHILEVQKPTSAQRASTPDIGSHAKLKDKDRQNIKDKFKGFNTEFEEIYKIQKAYAIPDSELRLSLIKDNREFVLPIYKVFREKYASVQFTKNPEKYIKYSEEQVSQMMDKFFDISA